MNKKYNILYSELVDKYCNKKLSCADIAKYYGCSSDLIRLSLKKVNVSMRSPSDYPNNFKKSSKRLIEYHSRHDTSGINNPFYRKEHTEESKRKIRLARSKQVITDATREKLSASSKLMWATNGKKIIVDEQELRHQYIDLKLPIKDIVKNFKCSKSTIRRNLDLLGLQKRNLHINIGKEKLEDLYINQTLSMQDIAELYNCSIDTIYNKMHEYNVPTRNNEWTDKAKYKVGKANRKYFITKEELENKYCIEGLSSLQIAELYHCTKTVILLLLKKYKITIRHWDNMSISDKNKVIKRIMERMQIRPNKPETFVNNLLNFLYPNEWKYVGNGEIIINGFNPDFININGQKKIIELYGDYWHGMRVKSLNKTDEENRKIDRYAKYGYSTLIIWENELKNMKKVVSKICRFAEVK